jgi:hypothetical protein
MHGAVSASAAVAVIATAPKASTDRLYAASHLRSVRSPRTVPHVR